MNKVNILLVAINSKYIHSNLAVRYLKKYALSKINNVDIDIIEISINQHYKDILSEIAKKEYKAVIFSSYIWNIELIEKLSKSLKLIYKDSILIAGGPEVSYETKSFLTKNRSIDYVIKNEGEIAFLNIIKSLINDVDIKQLNNICYIDNNEYYENKENELIDLNEIPFAYDESDFTDLEHKIIYYETSRGCPYFCSYCMSSLDKTMRFIDMDILKTHLKIFLDKKVKQVKFVDRTFNFDAKRAREIWGFIISNDNGVTNFHCEIAAMLVSDECIEILKKARNGLIQFEIGIQTTNEKTTVAIKRPSALKKITEVVLKLNELNNIHQHLDLIIGLPFEDFKSFKNSFNYVHKLSPEQLQVGFLKVLKGSPMYYETKNYGIIYDPNPPYEILYNNYMTYDEISFLKIFEDVIEKYQNSLRYKSTIEYLKTFFSTPFDFFISFSTYYKDNGYMKNLSKENMYKTLFNYGLTLGIDKKVMSTFIRFDMMCFNKVTKNLSFLTDSLHNKFKEDIVERLSDEILLKTIIDVNNSLNLKQVIKNLHIEVFLFDPQSYNINELDNPSYTMYLFNYLEKVDEVNFKSVKINF